MALPQVLIKPTWQAIIHWLIDSFIIFSAAKMDPLENSEKSGNIWQHFPQLEVILVIFPYLQLFVFSHNGDNNT